MCILLGVSLVHSGTGSTSYLQIRFFTTVKCLFIFVICSVPNAAPRPSWELWIVCWKILVHYNTKKQCQEFIGNMMVGHFWASVCGLSKVDTEYVFFFIFIRLYFVTAAKNMCSMVLDRSSYFCIKYSKKFFFIYIIMFYFYGKWFAKYVASLLLPPSPISDWTVNYTSIIYVCKNGKWSKYVCFVKNGSYMSAKKRKKKRKGKQFFYG